MDTTRDYNFQIEPVDETPSVAHFLAVQPSATITGKTGRLRKTVLVPRSGPTLRQPTQTRSTSRSKQGVTVAMTRSTSGSLRISPTRRHVSRPTRQLSFTTVDLAPEPPASMVPALLDEPAPLAEPLNGTVYVWLVLIALFLLSVLGGIGFDWMIASYRW